MATSLEFIEYVCDQICGVGTIRYKKMFGEFMVYVNDKPLLLISNATVYVKQHPCIADMMEDVPMECPYHGAKEHYILDIDNRDFCQDVIRKLEPVIALPKPRKKKSKGD